MGGRTGRPEKVRSARGFASAPMADSSASHRSPMAGLLCQKLSIWKSEQIVVRSRLASLTRQRTSGQKTKHSRRSSAPASADRPNRRRDGRIEFQPNCRPAKAVRSPTHRVIFQHVTPTTWGSREKISKTLLGASRPGPTPDGFPPTRFSSKAEFSALRNRQRQRADRGARKRSLAATQSDDRPAWPSGACAGTPRRCANSQGIKSGSLRP